jgi:hydroxymethylpyrimidine pyrophosphatase-like HAD family hydrolase
MVVVIDFDGTCVTNEFPRIGDEIGATPVLKELVQNGHELVLFTSRKDQNKWLSYFRVLKKNRTI